MKATMTKPQHGDEPGSDESPRGWTAVPDFVGRARKVSVSMPEDLSYAVRERVGRGEFSRYVSDAVARQLELDLLGELVETLEAEHGVPPEEMIAEAEAAWPDAE
ncbi:hypothetical protein ACFO4E_04880 [Nocardiopsis mangrovi]|uniref:CopG family transcriptional regulator n=1 Tax=Nocardiopsis mangrovi TaxID=1179818 RepID=A0ABV9DS33_9ACTN